MRTETDPSRPPDELANIPYRIHPAENARLAGFPRNVLYTGLRSEPRDGSRRAFSACYYPDPKSYSETEQTCQLSYLSNDAPEYRLEITLNKQTGVWDTRKFRGRQ